MYVLFTNVSIRLSCNSSTAMAAWNAPKTCKTTKCLKRISSKRRFSPRSPRSPSKVIPRHFRERQRRERRKFWDFRCWEAGKLTIFAIKHSLFWDFTVKCQIHYFQIFSHSANSLFSDFPKSAKFIIKFISAPPPYTHAAQIYKPHISKKISDKCTFFVNFQPK